MAVGGMVGVGLFYTAIGLWNLRSNHPLYDDNTKRNVSERTARPDNLYGEPRPLAPSRLLNLADAPQLRLTHDEDISDA